MIYTFIRERLAGDYPVRVCCQTLGVSTSGYYHARSRGPSRRDCRHALLAEHVRVTHEATCCGCQKSIKLIDEGGELKRIVEGR